MEADWLADFTEECERSLRRSVDERMRYGFTCEYKPIRDNAPWRSFDSMEEYRRWCDENLPKELGYGTSDDIDQETLDRQIAVAARRELDRRKELRLGKDCRDP